jgi:agmatine deiminase
MESFRNFNFSLSKVSLPSEWSIQQFVLLTWPHKYSDWKHYLNKIEKTYIDITEAISKKDNVKILCYDELHKNHVINLLSYRDVSTRNISFLIVKTNDTWIRDYGPISVYNDKKLVLLNFSFNGWGERRIYELDNKVNKSIDDIDGFGDVSLIDIPIVLEAGNIETDGHGTLIMSSNCLFNNRNNYSKNEYEKIFKKLFNIKQLIFIENSYLEGDDTDGHIDNLIRFIDDKTICYLTCDDEKDKHYQSLKKLEKEVYQIRNTESKSYKLIPLPLPYSKYRNTKRLPASYLNFLITNNAILLPVFNDEKDNMAINNIKPFINNRDLYKINASPLIEQGGGIHCCTMQVSSY